MMVILNDDEKLELAKAAKTFHTSSDDVLEAFTKMVTREFDNEMSTMQSIGEKYE